MSLSVKKTLCLVLCVLGCTLFLVQPAQADEPEVSMGLGLDLSRLVAQSADTFSDAQQAAFTPNVYPIGECTWGAKELAPWVGENWGNAGQWAASAKAAGLTIGEFPKLGAVMVWTDGGYGHVAVVTEVGSDGQIQVQEANYSGNRTVGNYRGWFDPAIESMAAQISYIYAPLPL